MENQIAQNNRVNPFIVIKNKHADYLATVKEIITEQDIEDSVTKAVDNYTGKPPENYECAICHKLVYDP